MTTTTLKPTVCGVGINDVPGSYNKPYYITWTKMFERCYDSKRHIVQPTYIGCTVDPRWHHLSDFKRWYEQQGDVKGKQLDKDIISPGNKVYGPDTCIFVPPGLNNFFLLKTAARGACPIGVTYKPYRKERKYRAETRKISGTNQRKHIGYYHTPEEAYKAYIKAKREILYEDFILPETNKRLKNALMYVYNNMEKYFK